MPLASPVVSKASTHPLAMSAACHEAPAKLSHLNRSLSFLLGSLDLVDEQAPFLQTLARLLCHNMLRIWAPSPIVQRRGRSQAVLISSLLQHQYEDSSQGPQAHGISIQSMKAPTSFYTLPFPYTRMSALLLSRQPRSRTQIGHPSAGERSINPRHWSLSRQPSVRWTSLQHRRELRS